jgi:hypothetical protein
VCSECGLFGQIRPYTVFHFYFLLIVYGFRYQRRYLCDTCAQKTAIRTLLLNLIFLVGVPTAVYNYFKARSEGDSEFAGLAKANALALKGNYQEADRLYDRLSMQSGHHPGILMNQGLGHLRGGDTRGAVEFFHASLGAAPNYGPTWQVLDSLSVQRGGGDHA